MHVYHPDSAHVGGGLHPPTVGAAQPVSLQHVLVGSEGPGESVWNLPVGRNHRSPRPLNNWRPVPVSRLFVLLPAEEIWSSRLHETAIYTLGAAAGAHGSFHGRRRSY